MKLISPTLNIDKIATAKLIEEAVMGLQGKEDPFLILESDELTYAQILWVGSGYELEYQSGSIDRHYIAAATLDANTVIAVLKGYLTAQAAWHQGIRFNTKVIRDTPNRLGYLLGYFCGKLFGTRKKDSG